MADPNAAGKPALQKPPGYRAGVNNNNKSPKAAPSPPPIRKPVFPSTFNPKPRRRRSCCRCFCCCFCTFLFFFILLIVLFSAMFYFWFNPKLPSYNIKSLQFDRFNVSVKPGGTYLNAQTTIRFEAKNPNEKMTFHYGVTHVRLNMGEDVELESANIKGFTQGKKNMTVLKFETKVDNMLISDADGVTLMNGFKSKKIDVSVLVRTSFGITLDDWKLKLGMMPVRVMCENMNLKNLQEGAGAKPKCTVNLLKLINIHG
ncbi:hypothetical protein AQUCO_01300165v1 [Aquilegia coerulea]|uniref:Late embryogenesis abundant protein LEA-2 subgroup domain-containing protein n=1 Tax=Aquilegia coerulea TaxID=218851 RepID=A0A2G5E014_AQUCA|nr:hypothetical protein AQUCO_01300165v1 [Aquilegia coerulea]